MISWGRRLSDMHEDREEELEEQVCLYAIGDGVPWIWKQVHTRLPSVAAESFAVKGLHGLLRETTAVVPIRLMLFVCLIIFGIGLAQARAGDFYVVTGTFSSQEQAQDRAALTGGWVLGTDLYSKLAPGRFAVVRGPFRNLKEAQVEMTLLKKSGLLGATYVRDAGRPRLPSHIGSSAATPVIIAALLGELAVEVADEAGGTHPCEPQEPYQAVTISYVGVNRHWDAAAGEDKLEPTRKAIDLGGFWVIKRTGEIQRMRICAE
jgi:hypothetical protein